ncbi:MAG TPA: hypothetical protein VFQ70_00345, partial [Candidatus Saccharimonadaceae bacterium]|nr:hypothetical protein [Candidatus Saccharimonadaceae bacterium]
LYHAEHGQVPPISSNTLCLTQDNSCTNYAGTQITASNTSLLNMLSPYGSVPQSVAHLGSDYGIYATFSSNYSYETSSGAATSTPTPVLVVFWLQGTNQDCTGITGMTSVSGNNPFYPGNYSNPSTANNALTRCYEVFTGYTQ